MKINTIENADCVKAMKKCLDDESIDMIIADPPYVISRPSQLGTMPDRKKPRTGTFFGDWDKDFDNKKWLNQVYCTPLTGL